MGIVVKNEYKNHINKIIPICDRIIIMTLEFAIKITIIVAYAPTAEGEDCEKQVLRSAG